ncbi:MAG TPA: septum site-determining protein MinC [Deinococcales bacterium]|nr:septum site-determining protein MinC [Deinococcales bacterium]
MKLRGTTGGLNLLIEPNDTAESLTADLGERAALLAEPVDLELAGVTPWEALAAAASAISAADGLVRAVRPQREARPEPHPDDDAAPAPAAETEAPQAPAGWESMTAPPPVAPSERLEIVTRTLRSGTRREVAGSVIVLGDVNPGVELIAGGDVIVVGTLRGLAHAGAGGRRDAIIYASRIVASQVRIAHALARAPEGSSFKSMQGGEADDPEIARLEGDQIVIEPYTSR